MPPVVIRIIHHLFVAVGAFGLACFAVAATYVQAPSVVGTINGPALLLAFCLPLGIVIAYQFPLPVERNTTIQVTGIPIYIAVVLLPPILAAVAVGLGILGGELTARCRCANPISHVAVHTARLALVALCASTLAHATPPPLPDTLRELTLIGAGVALWVGDFATILLVLMPHTRESPVSLLMSLVRRAGAFEGVQYAMGLVATLATMRHLWVLPVLALPAALVYVALKRADEKQEDTRRFLESMADAVDLRDPYTGGHSRRVTELTSGILQTMRKHGKEAQLIIAAARVHDIGKIGMPDSVLMKEGKLTDEEWTIMRLHPERGADLLMRYRDFAQGATIVRHHHERWDGTGYPHRLQGSEIPFGSRVIAVSDSFDAMTSDRPYRKGMSTQRAAAILRDGRGTQWDGAIVDAFLESISDRLQRPGAQLLRIVPDPSPDRDPSLVAETG